MTKEKITINADGETPDFDFDAALAAFDVDAEATAIEELAAATAIQFVISEQRFFVGRFPDKKIVKAPLSITSAQIDAIDEAGGTPSDQLKMLFDILGDDQARQILEDENMLSVIDYAKKFFDVFARVAGASLGE